VFDSALVAIEACPWDGYDPATIKFCEARLCAWVVEPANAYTSLTKTLAGLAILWSCRRNRDALILVGIAAFLQGFFGFSFHATGAFWGEALDVSGMFTISGLFLAFAARRLYGWSDRALALSFVSLVALSVGILLTVRPSGIYLFTAQIVLWVLLEAQLYRTRGQATDYRYLRFLVLTFAIAFGVWIADITEVACDPDNHIFNLHSLWHVLTSLALYWFYAYQTQFRKTPWVRL
jgi:hypothetical protein